MKTRVGTVAYLNALPLTSHLPTDRYEVVADHPRAIARALEEGEVDVALVPVGALLHNPSWRIVPGWCVGALGPVHSVIIAAESPPEDWTELVLDGTSRSSVTLARLLVQAGPLRQIVRPDLVLRDVPPGAGPGAVRGTTAAVIIGDPARSLPAHWRRYDLAELWHQWTGRPFVFAVWAARDGLPDAVQADLRAAAAEGVARIAERWSGEDLTYLTQHIRYALDEPAIMGLREFAARAEAAGLVRTGDVQFLVPNPTNPRRTPEGALAGLEHAPADEVVRLATGARGAELALLADERRLALDAAATWCSADRASVQEAKAAITAAAVASRAALLWEDLERLNLDAAEELVRATAAAGLQVGGLRLSGLLTLAHAGGVTAGEAARRLSEAGLTQVSWVPGEGDDALPAAREAGLTIEATLTTALDARWVAQARATVGKADALRLTAWSPPGDSLQPGATPLCALRVVAVARLLCDVPRLALDAHTVDLDGAQTALSYGANDLGPIGATHGLSLPYQPLPDHATRALVLAGHEGLARDLRFETTRTQATIRRVRPVHERAV